MHLTYAIKLYVWYELIPALANGNSLLFLRLTGLQKQYIVPSTLGIGPHYF